ncbi:MAG: neuC, partial [Rhizobacter sp.]|nr:neuC [Rhizobacter sp.]
MTRRIAVFTGTRADYGLLQWLMHGLKESPDFELCVMASGTHLSPEFGLTASAIEQDGFTITEKVEMLLSSDSPVGVAKSMGLGMIGYADALQRLAPDAIVILGDRFEALAAAQTALVMRIPIVHVHGGEITEGAYDDAIRHAISKMAHLHFASCESHRRRLIQMGEEPSRVFNVGAVGLEHLVHTPLLDRRGLSESLSFDVDKRPFMLVSFHPTTAAIDRPQDSYSALLEALDHFSGHAKIITYSNADNGGRELIALARRYQSLNKDDVLLTPSLGQKRYLSAMKYAALVVGNSSSGIIEAPAFGVASVNIGDRQKGRLCAESVIHCGNSCNDVVTAIHVAL